MPPETATLSEQNTPSRRVVRLIGLTVIVSGLASGCAAPNVISRRLAQQTVSLDATSLIRSQDQSPAIQDSFGGLSTSASADYGSLQSRFGGSAGHDTAELMAADNGTSHGHSFLRPRGRLGRPILLPETPFHRGSGSQTAEDNSPAVVDDDSSLEDTGRSPWPQQASSGGLSKAAGSPFLSNTDDADIGNASSINDRVEEATPADVTADDNVAGKESAVDPIEVAAGETEPIIEGQEPYPGEVSADVGPSIEPGAAPMQEPTMLDRLRRGLTAPRFEDNTDKLKKQIRRWPDPFGLLRDRDETLDSAADTATPAAVPGNLQTTDVTTAQSGLPETTATTSEATLETVIAELEKELSEWPMASSGRPERPDEWRRRQTDVRMLYLVAGQSAESVRVIEALPQEEQEFWQSLMLAVNSYRDSDETDIHSVQRNQALEHLRNAARKLQAQCTLKIQRVTFCDRIDGFGRVAEFPAAEFAPGQRVLVYAEVRNFRTELTDDGHYRSEFGAVLEFRREDDGEVLDTIRLPQIHDECSAERTDYFQSFELTVPALAGKYRIRIELTDQLSLQTAESQLEFHVR